ncbi:AAA family ATPase [bacterium]|nr:AAA family ATPase [bacterium]
MPLQVSAPMQLVQRLQQAVAAPREALVVTVCTAIAGGHLLLEDVPGVGKTLLAKRLAESLGLGFRRVQFSPDLLPSDLTGARVFRQVDGTFAFVPGPLFTPVLLADEINRASPRVQAGLLEAMEEGQVSVDGTTYPLSDPFFVIATQNPVHFEGTYPLPEVQLDRFMAAVSLGYPSFEAELALLEGRHGKGIPAEAMPAESLQAWRQAAAETHVAPELRRYLLAIVHASRNWPDVVLGISPRGALAWQALACAHAFVQGRGHLVPDDLKATAVPALVHRLVLRGEASRARAQRVVEALLAQEAIPR